MSVFRTFSAPFKLFVATRGDALRACPWLSYPAPLALPIALAHSAFGAADRAGSFRLWRCRSRWLIPPLALPIAPAHSAFGAVHRPRSFRFGAGISDSKPSHALFCCDYSSVQLPDNLVRDLVDVQSSYRRLVLTPLR